MRPSLRASRLGLALTSSALLTTFALSGCGSVHSGGAATGASTPAAPAASATTAPPAIATTPPASTAPASSAPASAPAQPAGGPVPADFAATSVTFVSTQEAFVLGTAPCSHAPCTSIVRTLNRGGSWVGLPAPVVPLGQSYSAAGPAVWGIRFADPAHGFVFGNGLWETTDGGEHWTAAAAPQGSILSLEVIDGQVLALVAPCTPQNGCGQTANLERRALSGGAWQVVTQVSDPRSIATQARVAAVLSGGSVIVTGDGGLTIATHATPCDTVGQLEATSVAVTSSNGLALMCAGGAAMGSVQKTVYVSDDLGASWTKVGTAPLGGDPVAISAGTSAQLIIAAASGASELYDSADGGANWGTAYQAGDGGMGFNDLGFTSTTDGVVVHGPAMDDGNHQDRPGQLLLTSNGGATWQVVTF